MLSSAASCCGILACGAASGAASGCNMAGKAGEQAARITYVVFVFLACIIATMLKLYGEPLTSMLDSFNSMCTHELCQGNQAVYRVSFAVVMFFAFMMFFAPVCNILHTQLWQAKVPLYLILLAGSFFIPNEGLVWFVSASRVISVLFLMVSVLILIEFAYDVHEELTARAVEDDEQLTNQGGAPGFCSTRWRVIYISVCLFLFIGTILAWAALFVNFNCSFAKGQTAICIVLGLVLMIGSAASEQSGLLPGCVVNAYLAWLCGSALSKYNDECNPFRGELEGKWLYIGIVIAALTIGYTGWSVSSNFADAFGCGWCEDDANKQASRAKGISEDEMHSIVAGDVESAKKSRDTAAADSKPRAVGGCSPNVAFFHLVMTFSGCYMAMILTNWQKNPKSNDDIDAAVAAGQDVGSVLASDESMWAIFSSEYICAALFLMTIVAPLLFPDRDFSDAKNRRSPKRSKPTKSADDDLAAQQEAVANFK